MSGQMPAYILREWNNDGKLLVGGFIYFTQSGTTTPKTVYSDAALTIPLPNPVVLDAGGAADIFLGDGAYRVRITTAEGVQVRAPLDGVVGAGGTNFGGAGSNISGASLAVYNDLRTLTTVPDLVYVSGRLVEGDGGAGWFQLLPTTTITDDDGVILTSGSGAHTYKRVFDGFIDPLWYGVRYALALDQSIPLTQALAGSAVWNFPLLVARDIYLTQNVTVPAGSTMECLLDGFFVSSSAISMAFAAGSKFSSVGVAFGQTVAPTFAAGVAQEIRLSWFGGATDHDRWVKMAASTSQAYRAVADVSTDVTQDISVPTNLALDFAAGAKLTISGLANLSIGSLVYQGALPIITYTAAGNVGAVAIGAPHIFPEWFGAVGDGVADDSIPFHAAAQTGSVYLRNSYRTTDVRTYTALSIDGPKQPVMTDTWNSGSLIVGGALTASQLFASNVLLYTSVSGGINGLNFYAESCMLDQAAVGPGYVFATSIHVTMCRMLGFSPTTPSISKIDCLYGSLAASNARTTNLDVGINRAGMFPTYKVNIGTTLVPVFAPITSNDTSLVLISNPLSLGTTVEITVNDPDPSAQGSFYYKIAPVFLAKIVHLNGRFRVGGVSQTTVSMAGGTSAFCSWLELVPSPYYPGEWQVLFGQNF